MDRISELPESILHHILSFLSFNEVAQTSVLSKNWQRVWRTYPVLEFDETIFGVYFSKLVEHRRRNELFNCMVETMRNRHKDMISLTEFTLSLPLSDERKFTSFLNQCVCHAIGCNVKKLKLVFRGAWVKSYPYNLPQIVFSAKSLETLELKGCKVELPRNKLNLPSLRKLDFSFVCIDDQMVKNLVSGCPLIEYLKFSRCEGFKNIELFGLPRLNKCELSCYDEVERLDIKLPNVRSLRITSYRRTCEINLASCKNLTRLMLYDAPITDEWLHGLISKLLVLEFLSIDGCYMLRTVKISSSCLEELDLDGYTCNWIELKIDTPYLRYLKYDGTITSLSFNAPTLSKINLSLYHKIETQKFIEFFANFHNFSEALSVEIDTCENVMVPGELRRTLSSPLSSLELFTLRFRTIEACFSIEKLVDGLLWIAPHTKTISIRNYCTCELSFEFTYKKPLIHEGKTTCCCKSYPISCWDYCMEAVNVKFREGFNLTRHTLRGARIWDKIAALSDVWRLLISEA